MKHEMDLPDLPGDMEYLVVVMPVRRPESDEARQEMQKAAREAALSAV